MSNEHTTNDQDQPAESSRTWVGSFGPYHFRIHWSSGAEHREFHLQGPFVEDDDPDGIGTPFSPDLSFVWENGQQVSLSGEYAEPLNNIRKRAKRIGQQASQRTRSYRQRTMRRIRDRYWGVVENELRAVAKKAIAEFVEESLPGILSKSNQQQSEKQSPQVQRVPIEYEKQPDPFDDEIPLSSKDTTSTTSLSTDERNAQRRVILDRLRTGAISLEEAEQRLNDLG